MEANSGYILEKIVTQDSVGCDWLQTLFVRIIRLYDTVSRSPYTQMKLALICSWSNFANPSSLAYIEINIHYVTCCISETLSSYTYVH